MRINVQRGNINPLAGSGHHLKRPPESTILEKFPPGQNLSPRPTFFRSAMRLRRFRERILIKPEIIARNKNG